MSQHKRMLPLLLSVILLLGMIPGTVMSGAAAAQTSLFPPMTQVDTRSQVDQFNMSNPPLRGYEYTVPADRPAAPGDVFTPKTSGKASDALAIGTVTANAGGDDTIVIEGTGLTGASVWVYAQTTSGNGTYYKLAIISGDDTTLTAVMPGFKEDSLYLVWVQKGDAYSRPARINAPAVEWISHTTATTGNTVYVYGTDLTLDAGEKATIYLRPWGADKSVKSVKAEVTECNPYRVAFRMPAGLKAGTDYEVWLHSGHGGEYGWAGPQKLRYSAGEPFVWNGNTVDVTKYGASPAAGNDDTKAIKAAVKAAKNGDILYFPAGDYQISSSVFVTVSLHIKGAGATKTIIRNAPQYQARDDGLFNIQKVSSQVSNIGFTDEGTPAKKVAPRFLRYHGSDTLGTTATIIRNCRFIKKPTDDMSLASDPIAIFEADNILLEDCYFHVPHGPYLTRCKRIRIVDNELQGNWIIQKRDGPNMFQLEGVRMIDVSDNYLYSQDYVTDKNGNLTHGDYAGVRAFCFQQNSGPAKNIYIAGNKTRKVGNPDDNCGELILFEHIFKHFADYPTAVSGDGKTLTFGNALPGTIEAGSAAVIIAGRGMGQIREVTGTSGNKLTVQGGWSILPDATSHVMVVNAFYNTVVYNNDFEGFKNYYENFNAGAGFQAYGNMLNFRADSNKFTNLMAGIRLSPHYFFPDGVTRTDYYATFSQTIVENNTLNNVCWGVAFGMYYGEFPNSGEIPAHTSMNTVIRRNTISNIRNATHQFLKGCCGNGIMIGTEYKTYAHWEPNKFWPGAWITNTVIEHNTISNAQNHYILLQQHQGGTVLRGNVLQGATAQNGIAYEDGAAKAVLAENTLKPLRVVPLNSNESSNPPPSANTPEDQPSSSSPEDQPGASAPDISQPEDASQPDASVSDSPEGGDASDVGDTSADSTPDAGEDTGADPLMPKPGGLSVTTAVLILAGVLLICGGAILLVWWLFVKKKKDTASSPQSSHTQSK